MSGVRVSFNEHGKGRVRLVKLRRNPNGVHDVLQMQVQVLLQGDCMEDSFTEGNNRNVSLQILLTPAQRMIVVHQFQQTIFY